MNLYTYPCDFGFCCIASTQKMSGELLCGVDIAATSEEAMMLTTKRFASINEELFVEKHNEYFYKNVLSAINDGTKLNLTIRFARGTRLQMAVWRYLYHHVAQGQTISYKDLAREVEEPKAVRAVASAVSENPIAVIVPCHRVVKSDGKHSGFRWGLDLKKKLLDREKKEVTF